MRLTLLTYNILEGGRGREPLLTEIIAAQNADVIVLQEVAADSFVETFAAQNGYNLYIADSNSTRTIGLLSRLPIQSASSFHPPQLRHTFVNATLEYAPGRTFTLFGVHLAAPAFTSWVEWYRLRELDLLLKHIRAQRADNYIVAGDFNSIAPGDHPDFSQLPLSLRMSVLLQGGHWARQVIGKLRADGFIDVFRTLHPNKSGFTLPAADPTARLDYFFVNPALRDMLRACQVVVTPSGVQSASDHLPVRLDLEL